MKQNEHYPPVNITGRVMAERAIIYRPQLKQQIGSVTGSLLLNQINHWFHVNDCKPFWKFAAKCEHRKYRTGDSWQEELGFNRSEYENALKSIATRIKPTERLTSELKKTYDADGKLAPVERIVIYWRDRDNVTWYWLNEELYLKHLEIAYRNFTPHGTPTNTDNDAFANVENEHSSNVGIQHSTNVENEHYPYTEMYIKEEHKEIVPATHGTPTNTDDASNGNGRKQRPMYDAIKLVWGYEGGLNGRFERFLTDRATKKDGNGYVEANINPPVTPDELLDWRKWYAGNNPDPKYMVKSPVKVQESVYEFRRWQQAPQPQGNGTSGLAFATTITDESSSDDVYQQMLKRNGGN